MPKIKIVDNVVHGDKGMLISGHLSYGQYLIEKLREIAQDESKVALICGETGKQTKLKQILQDVVDLATGLKDWGLKRNDVVMICSENRIEFLLTAIASICCGAPIATANPAYSQDEMKHVLSITNPKIVFSSELALKSNMKTFKTATSIKKIVQFDGTPLEKGVIPYSEIVSRGNIETYEAEDVHAGWSDVVYIPFSSGTTGLPKGVMWTHLNALYSAANHECVTIKEEEYRKYQTLVPWYHAYGLISTLNFMIADVQLVYFNGFSPEKYLNAIQLYKINVLLTVPPIVVFLGKSLLAKKYDLSSVKLVWCAAAPLSSETIQQAMKRLPNCKCIMQAYGMTETSLAVTQDIIEGVEFRNKPGSGGVPLNGVKVKVVNVETRQKLGPYENGEICVKGPVITKGYMGDKASTRSMIDDEGYLKTGDIGYYDQDGYFFVVDRLKELIKYKGNQVPPALVESVLLQHSGVAECGVVGAPDERAGELPTAFIVCKPGAQLSEQDLIDFTNTRLSPEKRLHGGVIFLKEIPKNASGKILRRVLREQLQKIRSKL